MKNGWQTKSIGAVCDVVNGGTPKTGVAEYWNGQHQWITPAEMGKRPSPYVAETERTLTKAGLENSSARPLPAHSVILSSRAPIGHLVINTVPMATNQGCKGLIPGKELEHKFLYYYLGSAVELLNSLGTGATFKELSGGKLKEVLIPVPPLPEQQRIVRILDEAFAGLATATANAEKNLQNARALFESHLQSVFTQRGEGWVDRKLQSLCREITVGYVGPMAKEYKESGVTFLRSQNIRPFRVSLENALFISREFDVRIAKSRLRPGDVAVVRTGYPGTAAVIPASLPESNCADLVIVRPGPDVEPQFLAAFFNSAYGKEHVAGKVVGAAQKHFNVGAAKETVLHLPSLQEQREIIAKFDALAAETERLEKIYDRKFTALEELKRSLLHHAFTGQL